MNDRVRSRITTVSVMCVMGWVADTIQVSRHDGWVGLVPAATAIMSIIVSYRLRQELNRA